MHGGKAFVEPPALTAGDRRPARRLRCPPGPGPGAGASRPARRGSAWRRREEPPVT